MIKRLDTTEFIFKIIAYTLLTVFAIFCLYPFVYAVSMAISGEDAVSLGNVSLFISWAKAPNWLKLSVYSLCKYSSYNE